MNSEAVRYREISYLEYMQGELAAGADWRIGITWWQIKLGDGRFKIGCFIEWVICIRIFRMRLITSLLVLIGSGFLRHFGPVSGFGLGFMASNGIGWDCLIGSSWRNLNAIFITLFVFSRFISLILCRRCTLTPEAKSSVYSSFLSHQGSLNLLCPTPGLQLLQCRIFSGS